MPQCYCCVTVRGGADVADDVGRGTRHLRQLSHAAGEATDVLSPADCRTIAQGRRRQHADTEPSQGRHDLAH